MKLKTKHFLLFIFWVSVSITIYAQDKQTLVDIIPKLQEQYQVQFNFAEDAVATISIVPPSSDLSLDALLEYLESETRLHFTKLNATLILIQVQPKNRICGYLKSMEDAMPIPFATIQGGHAATVTDDLGYFELALPVNNEKLVIRSLGYTTLIKSLKDFDLTTCQDLMMTPNIQQLPEVFISNYITEGITKVNNGSYTINFSKFDILPGLIDTDVLQSIQAFPGVQSVNETVSNISIRGGSHDQNLILWDHIKMYQSGHFFGLISMYNPQITQQVSLIKNGSSASLTDGVSGTILMQTEQDLTPSLLGSVGVNLIDVNGFIDMPLGTSSSIQVAARKSISDFVETPTYNTFFDRISQDTEVENNTTNITNSDKTFDFYDASLRWIYNFSPNDELRLNFITVANKLQFNENTTINTMSTSRESSLTQNSIAAGLDYLRRWSPKFSTHLQVYETDYKLESINANLMDSQRFLQKNQVSETSLKLKTNYTLSKTLNLLNGYHFVETEVTNLDDVDNPQFRQLISEVVRTHGLFTEINYTSQDKNTSLNLGVRYSFIDKFKKQIWEPRFSFVQQFLKHFSLEVLGEFKHQNTSQVVNFQNDFLGIEKRRWQLSNDTTIPVITSKQASVGVNYSKNNLLVSLEAYYKKIDGITSQSQGFQNQYEFVKAIGNSETMGIDFLIRKKIEDFNLWLSYSFMDNRYLFESLEETTFPSNYDITDAFTFGASYIKEKLKLSAGLNWHSGKPYTKPAEGSSIVNNAIVYEPTNSSRLEDYLRVDVSALYDCLLGPKIKGHFGVSIWNLLDKKNTINTFYRNHSGSIQEVTEISLGFTPNAVLRLYF